MISRQGCNQKWKNVMDMLDIALVIIVIFGAAAFMLLEERPGTASHPYKAKDHLFTAAERSFLGVLDKAIGDKDSI